MEKLTYAWAFLVFALLMAGIHDMFYAIPEALAHFFHGTPIKTIAGGSLVLLFGYFSGRIAKTSDYELSKVAHLPVSSSRNFDIAWVALSVLILGYAAYRSFDWSREDLFQGMVGGAPRFLAICFLWLFCVYSPVNQIHKVAETRRRHGIVGNWPPEF